jgi:hypothetical protein
MKKIILNSKIIHQTCVKVAKGRYYGSIVMGYYYGMLFFWSFVLDFGSRRQIFQNPKLDGCMTP